MFAALEALCARIVRRWPVLCAGLVIVAYAYPGALNWDSGDQLLHARHHNLGDWHPPVMGVYWRWLELVVAGPLAMLLLQAGLFVYGVYALLCRRLAPRAAAWLTLAVAAFPPVLTPLAVVWKDAQMAGFLVAGLALALRPERRPRAIGLALLVLASAVRDNGAAVLPPLCLLITAGWQLRGRHRTVAAAAALVLAIAGVAVVANRLATHQHRYPWYNSLAIHDLAGGLCHEAALSDPDVLTYLSGVPLRDAVPRRDLQRAICRHYTPRVWFGLTSADDAPFPSTASADERAAIRRAWLAMVRDHTAAYLGHRWDVMRGVLGLTDDAIWEPVCGGFVASQAQADALDFHYTPAPLQVRLRDWFATAWAATVLYRPWLYAALSLLVLLYARARRDPLIGAVVASGLVYEASFFLGAASPDFRYSHWMIVCGVLGAILAVGDALTRRRCRTAGASSTASCG
ncbi:MAG TPA: hypothetical protein VFP84_22070 [Kofleriaceae bacterium]|nr:hypothetical protein [Kofleriaceae bacterium]